MSKHPYATLRQSLKRPLFVPFVVLGDPNPKESIKIIEKLIASGADALELGFPYSDPAADGTVIQAADVRALKAGTTVDDCFAIIKNVQNLNSKFQKKCPVGLLVYYNLVFKRGIDRFFRDCKASGVDSVLIADLPLEHANEVTGAAKKHGIALVFIVSELTTPERLKEINKIAEGYLYVVSHLGVTGMTNLSMQQSTAKLIKKLRKGTRLPLFVGFGISSKDQVRAVAKAEADGVIVGSRIVAAVPSRQKIESVCKELMKGLG